MIPLIKPGSAVQTNETTSIARTNTSIRWKFEVVLAGLSVLFLLVSLITFGAMEFMHDHLHDIQDMALASPAEALRAVNELEDTQHGILFSNVPMFGLFGILAAAAFGSALAWSVIKPVQSMGDALRRIGLGDYSQPIQVENRDELGELAERINRPAGDIEGLQEAKLADERTRGLQERVFHVTMAQEEERRRISRELHDGLGPSLAGLGNRLRASLYSIRSDPGEAEREVEEVAQSLKGHIQEIRALSYDLRPAAIDQLGLTGAIRQHLDWFERGAGIRTSFAAPKALTMNSVSEAMVFRIVQECLNNIQKQRYLQKVCKQSGGVPSL